MNYFRYIESIKNKGLIQINETEIKRWMSNESSMFEVYKTIADIFKVPMKDAQYDLKLFKILKEIITQLLVVKPENRMKLQDAREKLEELDQFAKTKDFNYLLLNSFIQTDDPTLRNTDETTQNSLGLMDEIRSTRLFTTGESSEDDKKLTQRNTNLCVSVSAMRLLSYALVEFLEKTFTGDRKNLKDLTDKILKYSENPQFSKMTPEEKEVAKLPVLEPGKSSNAPPGFYKGLTPVKREPTFIRKLVTICCGVISPRSLNGLNHGHLDDDYQIEAQEQNIRK